MPSEMNAPQPNDAQRELEQRALRNVRGLVDKMEGIDAHDKTQQRRYLKFLFLGVVVFVVIIALLALRGSHPGTPPVVIDSSKTAPAK